MGCCGSTPAPPPAPDPQKVADAQWGYQQKAQASSLVDQSTPYGNLNYTKVIGPDGVPRWTANSQLSAVQQQLFDQSQNYAKDSGSMANKMLGDWGGKYGTNPDFTDMAGGLTQKLLGQETSYLNPVFDRQKSQLDAKLVNQGLTPDSPAYKNQMMDLERNQNSAITNFLTQAEPQAFQQAVSSYQLPLQTSAALAGNGKPGQLPGQFIGTGAAQVGPVDFAGISNNGYQNQLAGYQAQVGANNNATSALLGAAGTIGGGLLGGPFGAALGKNLFGA